MNNENKKIVDYLSHSIEKVINEHLSKNCKKVFVSELIGIIISCHVTSLFNLLERLTLASPGHGEQIHDFMERIVTALREHNDVREIQIEKENITLQ